MKWIASIVMLYMFAALLWWYSLLMRQNDVIHNLSTQPNAIIDKPSFEVAKMKWEKQQKMIRGEGSVFGLLLITGMFFIYRYYKKELEISRQQNNFLLAFSHELKSPLTSIKLSLETIKKRKLPENTQNEICDTALTESNRLETLINSILMVAKIDDFTLSPEKIDMSKLTNDIVNVMAATGEAINQITVYPNEEFGPLSLVADKQAMQSIIINLLENAIKYGNKKPINIDIKRDNSNIIFKICDQGLGINDAEVSKIFDKFYRVGDESIRKSKGTGLGLFIVKKLVDLHAGNVSVSKNNPNGTIFTISIPIKFKE